MLQLYKNQVVTAVAKQQVEIRKLELDWFTNNYWTLSQQGALLAGFSFAQITTSLPKDASFLLESVYLLLASLALGLQMCVVVTTTFCCMWGPGLALRGPDGIRSVHTAVDSLKSEHGYIFAFFFLGLISFYLSNLLLVWCYFEEWIAVSSSILLLVFLALIFYYTISLTSKLRVTEDEAVEGKIQALQAYENIVDLDQVYAAPSTTTTLLPPGPALPPADIAIEGTALRPLPRGFQQVVDFHNGRRAVGVVTLGEGDTSDFSAVLLPAPGADEAAPPLEGMEATPQSFLGALFEI